MGDRQEGRDVVEPSQEQQQGPQGSQETGPAPSPALAGQLALRAADTASACPHAVRMSPAEQSYYLL